MAKGTLKISGADALLASDLAPNSVDSSELVDGSVDLSHMSVNSIDSDQYVDGSIDNAHLADDAVGTDELANDVVINTSGAITTTGAFTSLGIDDNATSNAITIDASENVGIGTTSPSSILDLNTTGDTTLTIRSGSTSYDGKIDFHQGAGVDGGITYDHNSSYASEALKFRAGNNGTHMTIGGTGDVTVNTGNLVIGTAGKGITFSSTNTPAQSAGTGTSNTLDDYEEGTWTPVFTGGASNGSGTYTKIGNKVYVYFAFASLTCSAGASNVNISGLPFTAIATTGGFTVTYMFQVNWPASAKQLTLRASGGTILPEWQIDDGNTINGVGTDFDSGGCYFQGCGFYNA
jgi:hypothetical protein